MWQRPAVRPERLGYTSAASRCHCPDPERVARFEREAQLLATLNHANIGAIYGLDEAPSAGSGEAALRFLVLELIEGESLAQRLARGPLPVDEAVAAARQIIDALEAAHDKGIAHRDLKPGNVMLTADGQVEVLDFGLAKATEQGSGARGQGSREAANSPTITSPADAGGRDPGHRRLHEPGAGQGASHRHVGRHRPRRARLVGVACGGAGSRHRDDQAMPGEGSQGQNAGGLWTRSMDALERTEVVHAQT